MSANYIRQLKISTYRGISNLELNDLGAVNILLGDNNCGKTSVLEVIKSLQFPGDVRTWRNIAYRSQNILVARDSLFDAFIFLTDINNEDHQIKYSVDIEGASHVIEINESVEDVEITFAEAKEMNLWMPWHVDEPENEDTLVPDAQKIRIEFLIDKQSVLNSEIYNFSGSRLVVGEKEQGVKLMERRVNFISPVQHADARPFLKDVFNTPELYESMLNVLREFDPGVISINVDNGSPYTRKSVYKILSKENAEALPLDVYGDGMKKAILLMSAVVASKDGVLLIDEFETAIHISAMESLYSWLLESCKLLNVQLFMTTHSIEAVDKLLESSEHTEEIRVIRLKKKNGKTYSRILSGKEALEDRQNYDMELRI